MFPEYQFRALQANHPILVGQQFRADKWKERVDIEGLSNGTRELMLLIPTPTRAGRGRFRAAKKRKKASTSSARIFICTPPTSGSTA